MSFRVSSGSCLLLYIEKFTHVALSTAAQQQQLWQIQFNSWKFLSTKLVSSFSCWIESSLHIIKSLNVKKTSPIRSSVHDTQYKSSIEFMMRFATNHPGIWSHRCSLFHVTKCNSIYEHRRVPRTMTMRTCGAFSKEKKTCDIFRLLLFINLS